MAKDVITRFKLETTGFDSKIKQAAKELSDYSKTATQARGGFNQFTKANVDAAKALGTMATSTTNAKDRAKELVGAFNEAAKAYNALTKEQQQSDWAKALSGSLTQLQKRIKETKAEMQGLGNTTPSSVGGGRFGDAFKGLTGKIAKGNLYAQAAMMATEAVSRLGSEMADMVQQGIELAKQGEGVRIAFERLGRGDILDGLRQATHGTVTDIELMKAAVKFNDFKLPVEELGTMLAFAQQKAKDTGQSVDYMVDSIVTGLGRKSLMILDNLGLSATEVKDKMAETGDMTKAVGAIIREQMAKAGDYVETAADRAAQANVNLQNKMEELGRKFAPVEEASNQLWTSMKIGILDVVGGPLARLLNGLTEAGRLKNMLDDMNGEDGSGNTKVGQQLKKLNVIRKAGGSDNYFNTTLSGMVEDYNRQIMALDAQIKNGGKKPGAGSGESQSIRYLQEQMKALQIMRDQLKAGARELSQPVKAVIDTSGTDIKGLSGTTTTRTTVTPKTEEQKNSDRIAELVKQYRDLATAAKTADDAQKAGLTDRMTKIQGEIKALQQRNAEIKYYQDMAMGKDVRPMGAKVDTSGMGVGISNYSKVEDALKAKLDTSAIITPLQALEDELKRITELQQLAWSPEQFAAYQKRIEEITGKIDEFKGIKQVGKEWQAAGTAIQAVGSAMNQIEDPAAKVMGTIAQAIATIALTYAESLRKTFGPWDWIAAAAAGAATMVSTIATIHSATGYANGGMVKGNSYSGDNIPALVDGSELVGLNAGEIVLNAAQASNVASNLQAAGGGNVHVTGQISGEQILLVANRTTRRQGKGELLTWK